MTVGVKPGRCIKNERLRALQVNTAVGRMMACIPCLCAVQTFLSVSDDSAPSLGRTLSSTAL